MASTAADGNDVNVLIRDFNTILRNSNDATCALCHSCQNLHARQV
jgi:hypothetical protein